MVIDGGGVFVDGRRVKIASRAVRAGQRVQATVGQRLEPGATSRLASTLPPEPAIVYEDDALVIVDKPSGLPVAATAASDRGHLLSLLESRLAPRGRLYLVHRLDVPTSGLMVLAKTADANRHLARQFAAHTIEREYLAVLDGQVADDRRVDVAIGGRHAITHFAVETRYGARATRVRCRLETGRTHQIRIHAVHLGHPVLGDRRHGTPTAYDPPRLALHATTLGFVHPRSAATVRFTSPWPRDLTAWTAAMLAPAPDATTG
jgi:23S rRNA pseudouridine1911/1915/1917 synthase